MRSIQKKRWLLFGLFLIIFAIVNGYAYGVVMQIAADHGGWPWWPPVEPERDWVYETTGILGLTSRSLYLARGYFYLFGFLALLYRELSIRYDFGNLHHSPNDSSIIHKITYKPTIKRGTI
ncbi:MAG: hypothetical protein ACTSRQ_09370 [Candidatus Thorarchaeota archaeon]